MPDKQIITTDREGKSYTVSLNELHWRPSAYGLVIKDGAILLSPQDDGYDLPGGGVEFGEMLEETVLREVQEETGIIVSNPQIVACKSSFFTFPDVTDGMHFQSVLMYYVCDYAGGALSDAGFTEFERIHSRFPVWYPLVNGTVDIPRDQIASSYDWRALLTAVMPAAP